MASFDEPPAKLAKMEGSSHVSWTSTHGLKTDNTQPLRAEDVGISCYVDEAVPAFSGILKHRFLDFLVNEVTKDGTVVQLKDLSRPISPKATEEPAKPARVRDDKKWPEDADERLSEILSADKIAELKALHARGPPATAGKKVRHRNDPIPEGQSILSDAIESKDTRKAFHQLIRELFSGLFITEAKEVDGKSLIEIIWSQGNDERDRRSHPRPASHLKFIHFHLQKRNRETHDALSAISSALNVHVRDLGTTGTKDKRAVTVQRVSLRRGNHTVEDVWQAVTGGGRGGRGGRGRGRGRGGGRSDGRQGGTPCFDLKVGDLSYQAGGLELGDLGGNRFRLVLRDVQADSEETIRRAVETVRDQGFINYFGMQRFGNSVIGTHLIGLAILREDFKLAAELLLRPRPNEPADVTSAREKWRDTGDAAGTLQIMPRNCVAERCLLTYYSKNGHVNHANAIASIPKNLRMMYVHAYQSRHWNIIVSERIRLFGHHQPVAGDLVFDTSAGQIDETFEEDAEAAAPEPSDDPQNGADNSDRTQEELIAELKRRNKLPAVKALTETDLADYSVFDVVLPLAGFMITYPTGQLGERYRELMKADGLDPDNLYRKQPEYSMGGTYRKILHKPEALSYSLVRYDDPDVQLALSDEEVILGRTLPDLPADGKYLALKLDFTLKSSTYATMLLREVLKSETASGAQKALTKEMQARHAAAGADES